MQSHVRIDLNNSGIGTSRDATRLSLTPCSRRVHVFIARYRETESLHRLLARVLASLEPRCSNVTVINNHPTNVRDSEMHSLPPRVRVHHNSLRLTETFGQLARTWNEALVNGFGHDLLHPKVDLLITLHADAELRIDWWSALQVHINSCHFLQMGRGDELVAYTPEAVRRIGLWDERFTGTTHQEFDYFLRAHLWFPEHTCISDPLHCRFAHPLPEANVRRVLNLSASNGFQRLVSGGWPAQSWEAQSREHAVQHTELILRRKWCSTLGDKWCSNVRRCTTPNHLMDPMVLNVRRESILGCILPHTPRPLLYMPFEEMMLGCARNNLPLDAGSTGRAAGNTKYSHGAS